VGEWCINSHPSTFIIQPSQSLTKPRAFRSIPINKSRVLNLTSTLLLPSPPRTPPPITCSAAPPPHPHDGHPALADAGFVLWKPAFIYSTLIVLFIDLICPTIIFITYERIRIFCLVGFANNNELQISKEICDNLS